MYTILKSLKVYLPIKFLKQNLQPKIFQYKFILNHRNGQQKLMDPTAQNHSNKPEIYASKDHPFDTTDFHFQVQQPASLQFL